MTKSLEDIQVLEILHFTVPEKSLNTYAIKTRQKRTKKPSENTPSNTCGTVKYPKFFSPNGIQIVWPSGE